MEATDYCDYKLSLALKAAGFDELCRAHYTNGYANDDPEDVSREVKFHYDWTSPYNYNRIVGNTSAPTLWHAQKWLREKWGIAINVDAHDGDFYTWEAVFLSNASQDVVIEASLSAKLSPYVEKLGSYEAALSAGIASALELIITPSPDSRL